MAPGTVGTLWGIPLVLGLASLESPAWRVGVIVGLVLIGAPICGKAARTLGAKDPGAVVWDEFVTLPIVFLALPVAAWTNVTVIAVAFALHRVFDISKCPPVGIAERLPGGWGIMMDDVVAALLGAACLGGLHAMHWI